MFYVDSAENNAGSVSEVNGTNSVQRTIVEHFIAQSDALQEEQSLFCVMKSHKNDSILSI